jgi:type II secretory pathway predicted ATPase ExeA
MNPSLLARYGLKWNPFSQELPTEALRLTPQAEDFLWRIEQNHVREGGFALIHGDPGTGKSVVLRFGACQGSCRLVMQPTAVYRCTPNAS